jgi:hypothetical protein
MIVELTNQDHEMVLSLLERAWYDTQMERDRSDLYESQVEFLSREDRLEHLVEALQMPVPAGRDEPLRTVDCA